ncbi:MAG TPA: PEP-CTERM sorting domain-containing protein [Tepidisphaeraceae bacterium]|nr:PEP-CTERM sorting domain-containing protein [Tepidisphaeraceae bacterium]
MFTGVASATTAHPATLTVAQLAHLGDVSSGFGGDATIVFTPNALGSLLTITYSANPNKAAFNYNGASNSTPGPNGSDLDLSVAADGSGSADSFGLNYTLISSTGGTGITPQGQGFAQDRATFNFDGGGTSNLVVGTPVPILVSYNAALLAGRADVFQAGGQVFPGSGAAAGTVVVVQLSPIPEPASLGLMGLIVPALAMRRRKA